MKRAICSVCLILWSAMACGGSHAADDAGDSGPPPVVGARTALAVQRAFVETIDAIGTVSVAPSAHAVLAAPASARVASIHVSGGQRVGAGDPLLTLDDAPFRAAAASADAAVHAAQAASDRATRLADEGIAPRKDAEAAAAALAAAQTEAATAQRNEQLATLRAPSAGVVTRLSAS